MNSDQYVSIRIRELEPYVNKIPGKLIPLGGRCCNIPVDPLNNKIYEYGTLYNYPVRNLKMDKSCHENCWELHSKKGYSIHTGYVLGTDDGWYRHSWNVDDNGYIVETVYCNNAIKYYGLELTEEEFLDLLLRMGIVHCKIMGGIPSPFRFR